MKRRSDQMEGLEKKSKVPLTTKTSRIAKKLASSHDIDLPDPVTDADADTDTDAAPALAELAEPAADPLHCREVLAEIALDKVLILN